MPLLTPAMSSHDAVDKNRMLTIEKDECMGTDDETCCSTDEYSNSSSDNDSDDSEPESDDDMDQLEAFMNQIRVAPQISRFKSMSQMGSANTKVQPFDGPENTNMYLVSERMKRCHSEYFQSPGYVSTTARPAEGDQSEEKPEDILKSMLAEEGCDCDDLAPTEDSFLKITEEHIAAHSLALTRAARFGDLALLKQYLKEGKMLQCCNRFGESIIHIICRRGSVPLLRFLIDKTHVSMMVRDDTGRTPMHDAAWTETPNFELVKLLLLVAPELMFAKDKRGHSPLVYVPRQRRAEWCEFLRSNQSLLMPVLIKYNIR